MPVPLLDLTRENQPLLAEIQAAMQPVIEGSQFILGKVVSDFEQSAAEYFELSPDDLALGVSSGTDAQLLALMALEIDAGKEFICPPYTFFSTAGVI
ncbi:MAG: DegT/DnrJ/EryC1/StrS family aminotransferase, partial [Leptospiraceae bacterium]|nr:DegT/DnrJ/EryC1/StrS family aminotransferase [Leptospiraceae bacterium]